MPTHSDLDNIAKALYPNQTINPNGYTYNLTYTAGTATSLGLPEPTFVLWSGEEDSDIAYSRGFVTTYSGWSYITRAIRFNQAVCLGD